MSALRAYPVALDVLLKTYKISPLVLASYRKEGKSVPRRI